ncbi:hypothetical protein UFOVP75_73 [uncultured Caudovirales phage]|uniref:Uncharacterized protein n=1 Tax=uncultured Caudovirales phage TaxID=2100421 RepID=A0A6J5L3R4_9CAUD|nr:hypothetical protein UFOVP75_73 [uncultured Caudovirales phage]
MTGKQWTNQREIVKTQNTVSFDPTAFDNAISTQGVKVVHFRAMRCPVGMIDRYDNRRGDHNHVGCSNGFIYTRAGVLDLLFTGNGEGYQKTDVGFIDGSTAQVTAQRFYSNSQDDVHVAPFDRLYLTEEHITVPTWQVFEANITGLDRLQFPVSEVQDLMDSTGKNYKQDIDFHISGGQIDWNGGRARPHFDTIQNKGAICSVRYLYRPYWYVAHMNHQIRIAQVDDVVSGERVIKRMPQAFTIQREYIFEKDEVAPDEQSTKTEVPARRMPAPSSGSFGPR